MEELFKLIRNYYYAELISKELVKELINDIEHENAKTFIIHVLCDSLISYEDASELILARAIIPQYIIEEYTFDYYDDHIEMWGDMGKDVIIHKIHAITF